MISTTFSKLLEILILRECGDYEFTDLQFGFVRGRSTTMASALTHDVIDYRVHRGTPVYACALDAEGAFDAIPHAVLFRKAIGTIPDLYWRLLVYWYKDLVVQIKWGQSLSDPINIGIGTRQGGLSSPFLFNLFYQDLVNSLSNMKCGISINCATYNVFCYADDLLLTSTTVSGLQMLINHANSYIMSHGLRFNPTKTECISFGKSKLIEPTWNLAGTPLVQVDSITYLGVTLSNKPGDHASARIKSVRKAFYALQGAGLCVKGV